MKMLFLWLRYNIKLPQKRFLQKLIIVQKTEKTSCEKLCLPNNEYVNE